MSREGKLAKNTLILSIGTFLPKLASIITLPILTGCLTRSEMGTYDVILILESLFLPTATFQILAVMFLPGNATLVVIQFPAGSRTGWAGILVKSWASYWATCSPWPVRTWVK